MATESTYVVMVTNKMILTLWWLPINSSVCTYLCTYLCTYYCTTAQKRCLFRHFFHAVGPAKFGGEKSERKKRRKLSPHAHPSLSSMAKSKSIVLVQIKDNGAQRWFGIISSIKPGRLKGMQEEIHSLYEYVCTCCKSCWWWVHQARNKLNSQKHFSCHCCNWIA